MHANLKNHFGWVRIAGLRLKIESAVCCLQPAGVAAQLGEDGDEALLCPQPGETAIHWMHFRRETEGPIKKFAEIHGWLNFQPPCLLVCLAKSNRPAIPGASLRTR